MSTRRVRRPRYAEQRGLGRIDVGAGGSERGSVLRLLANGQSHKEIAASLEISERTVKSHLAHLFEKLGVTSRTEAVRIATRRGLVRFD